MKLFDLFNIAVKLVVPEPSPRVERTLLRLRDAFVPVAQPQPLALTHSQVMALQLQEAKEKHPKRFPDDRPRNLDGSLDLSDPDNKAEFIRLCEQAGSYRAAKNSPWWTHYGNG